jgi:hypothetical protein
MGESPGSDDQLVVGIIDVVAEEEEAIGPIEIPLGLETVLLFAVADDLEFDVAILEGGDADVLRGIERARAPLS